MAEVRGDDGFESQPADLSPSGRGHERRRYGTALARRHHSYSAGDGVCVSGRGAERYSRKVIGWASDCHLEDDLAIAAGNPSSLNGHAAPCGTVVHPNSGFRTDPSFISSDA